MDITELERANDYVDSIKWRLETLQSRSRYSMKTGELKKLPTRLRRFSNGIPQDNVAFTLDILVKRAPYDGVMFNGEDDEGLRYRPTSTVIRKDKSLESDGGDATYTIIQDLILVDEPDAYATGESASCSNIVTAEYHWDEPDVAECPAAEQGVSWQIASVSRDRDTDLFSFTVRKSVAITQHMAEQVTGCANDQTVMTETWDNVYGEPGAYRDDTGTAIGIPEPCTSITGDTVVLDISENPDCTFKIRAVRTTAKVVDGSEYLRMRDRYKATVMDFTKNARSALSKSGVEYANGAVTRYESKLNQDGTYDNRVTIETEREVGSSTVSRSVMPFQVKTERTDTNVVAAATSLLPGTKYGSFESVKTPGGLFTNKYVSIELIDMDLGVTCKDTLFQHDHNTEEMVKELPDLDSFHVPPAKDGVTHDIRFRLDGNGSIVKTSTVTTEHGVVKSEFERTISPRYIRYHQIDTAQTAAAPGLIGSATYGSYKSTRTPGGLYTNEYSTFEPVYKVFGYECTDNVFQHEHSSEESVKELSPSEHVAKASGGVITKVSARADENGIIVKRTDVTTEHSVPKSSVTVSVNPRSKSSQRTDTNMTSPATGLIDGAKYGSYKSTVTPGGLYTNEYSTFEPVYERFGYHCTDNLFQHEHTTEQATKELEKDHVKAASGGVIFDVTSRLDENGIPIRTERVTTEHAVPKSAYEVTIGPRSKTVRETNTNVNAPVTGLPSGVPFGSFKYTRTPGGLYVTELVTIEPTYRKAAVACSFDMFKHEDMSEESVKDMPSNPHVTKASGGKITEETYRVEESGAVMKTHKVTEEIECKKQTYEKRLSPRFRYVTQIDVNSPSPVNGLPSGSKYGSFKYTVTAGGRYNNEYTTVEYEKNLILMSQCSHDVFQHKDIVEKLYGETMPSNQHVVKASNGKIETFTYTLDEQGLVTERKETVQEESVDDASFEKRITALVTSTTTGKSNQKSPLKSISSGKKYGSVKSVRTPGGLYNTEETTVEPTANGKNSVQCKVDLFQHEHSDDTAITQAQFDAQKDQHLKRADVKDGLITETRLHMDDNGVAIKTTKTTQEQAVPQSTVEVRTTPIAVIRKTVNTNVQLPESDSEKESLPDGKKVGSVRLTKTPGGLYVKETTIAEKREDAGREEVSCTKDLFKHEHTDVTAAEEKDLVNFKEDSVAEQNPDKGETKQMTLRQDADGIVSKTEKTVTEKTVEDAVVEVQVTPTYDVKRTTHVALKPTDGRTKDLDQAKDVGKTKRVTLTASGRKTVEITEIIIHDKPGVQSRECTEDIFRHEDVEETTLGKGKTIPGEKESHVEKPKDKNEGTVVRTSYRSDERGIVTKREQKTVETEVIDAVKEVRGTLRGITTTTTAKSVPSKDATSKDDYKFPKAKDSEEGTIRTVRHTKTAGGRIDVEVTTFEPPPKDLEITKSRTRNVFEEEHVDEKVLKEKDLSKSFDKDHVDEPKEGTVTRIVAHKDEQGIVTQTKTTTTEREQEKAEVSVKKTMKGVVKQTTDRNLGGGQGKTQKTVDQLTNDDVVKKLKIGESVDARLNPGKTVNKVSVEVTAAEKGTKLSASCAVNSTSHTDVTDEVVGVVKEGVDISKQIGEGETKESKDGVSFKEEVKVDENGVITRETTKKTEISREFSVRVHEDMNQAYQVIERTSDAENLGDPNHVKAGFSANHDKDSGEGQATEIKKPTAFGEAGTPASSSANAERGPMSATLTENVTAKKVITKGGFKRGMQSVVDSELTDGGRFHTKEYRYIAKPQKWKDFIKTEKHISLKWTFRNLTQEQIDPLLDEVLKESAEYDYGTFTVTPSIQRTLNEFGLYDGTVGFTANSPAYGSGSSNKQNDENDRAATEIASWWEKSMQVTPVSNCDPNSSTYKAAVSWYQVRIVWTEYENGWGRGLQNYKNFLQGNNNSSFWAGSRHSYDQNSRRFTYLKIKNVRVRVFLVPGSKLPEAGGDLTKIFENAKVDDLGQKGEEGKLK